jgi:4-amino-4-deoxy-L-arabinose transferase-like glycosyltransferase
MIVNHVEKPVLWLGLITVLVNASAMLSPVIHSGDAVIYASIARHIALTHDWASLVLDGHDWLDKPHFPFWMTAICFRIGGVSALTYILPGFIFHLIGAYYTYRLARLLYDEQTGIFAALIYVSIFSLMDSSIEIKAEAYLRAEIVAACFYWLSYDTQSRLKYLLPGALFTGMAIMTKGIFSVFTIFSGLACSWLYQGQWSKLFSIKWLAALSLSLLCAAPELIALDAQFNQHGARVQDGSVFKFFFWDSQFGRFFNTGPIQNHNGYALYYVLVFLWAFLPWTLVSLAALYAHCKDLHRTPAAERASFVYLISTFALTFLMFSATKFQMSYYIDIILPFAAIVSAHYLKESTIGRPLFIAQMCLICLLGSLAIGLSIYVMQPQLLATMVVIGAALSGYLYATRTASLNHRAMAGSVLVINMLYIFSILLAHLAFTRFSLASNAAEFLGGQSAAPIYVYQMPEVSRELSLYSKAPTHELDTVDSLMQIQGDYYLIARHEEALQLPLPPARFKLLANRRLVVHKTGTLDKLLKLARGTWPLESIDFLQSAAN